MLGKLDKEFYSAVVKWNRKKNFSTFRQIYRDGFDSTAFFGFRIWRIIRNTFNGRYKDIELKVNNGEFVVRD